MAKFRPFKAIRPNPAVAEKVASLPYDVMNRQEAAAMAQGNPDSFLHICRSEIDLPESVGAYEQQVYDKARENLEAMLKKGTLKQDERAMYYIYRQIMWGRVQTGIVGCASIDDYQNDIIKKHELTRVEKEIDRINNFDACSAHTEPVFLTFRKNGELSGIINEWIKFHKPENDFTTEDAITHILWPVTDAAVVEKMRALFEGMDYLYIADGHHRSASSAKVGMKRREASPGFSGDEEFNYFMAVSFPDEDLFIMDYNRVVKDLNGLSEAEFLAKVSEKFDVSEAAKFKPMKPHTIAMLLSGKWYALTAKAGIFDENDPIGRLDVSILQNNLLQPILGIDDPRTDKRIDFVGGIRGLEGLEKRVGADCKVAFAMYPTTIDDLLSVADSGSIMPPKSTWFEPKLRSGLFLHSFE